MIEFIDSFDILPNGSGDVVTQRYALFNYNTTTGRLGVGQALSQSGTLYMKRNVTARTTYIQGLAVQTPSGFATAIELLSFQEQAGTRHISLCFNAAGKLEARKGSKAGTLLATSTNVVSFPLSFIPVAARVKIDSSVGTIDVWVNGVTCAGLTGLTGLNTDNGGAHTIDQCQIGDTVTGPGSNYLIDDYWIFNTTGGINDAFPGDVRCGYSAANAAGTYTSATSSSGTLLSCVQDAAHNNADTNYIIQDNTSLPKKVSFNAVDAPADALSILGVVPICIIRKDDAGANTGRLGLRSGSTEVDNGADLTPTSTYAELSNLPYDTDPATSAAWGTAGFNALEVFWDRLT